MPLQLEHSNNTAAFEAESDHDEMVKVCRRQSVQRSKQLVACAVTATACACLLLVFMFHTGMMWDTVSVLAEPNKCLHNQTEAVLDDGSSSGAYIRKEEVSALGLLVVFFMSCLCMASVASVINLAVD